jgi:pyruvate/2-oxoglutarate/acetoin dehydrogenase E1 component
LCVIDNGWTACGAGAEIISQVMERLHGEKNVAIRRMGYAPVTCPPTPVLEDLYYPNARTIAATAYDLVKGGNNGWLPEERKDLKEFEFRGPF